MKKCIADPKMGKLIARYIKKHPEPRNTIECYIKDKNTFRHVVTGAGPDAQSDVCEYRWGRFGTYVTRYNGISAVSYMDVDKVLGIYEISVIKVDTHSFKTHPAPRKPTWLVRRFFQIGDNIPYDDKGNIQWSIRESLLPFSDWPAAYDMGHGSACLTMLSRRLCWARPGLQLPDCFGFSFYDGHWKLYTWKEEQGNSWGYWWRFLMLTHPKGEKRTPKPGRTPALSNQYVASLREQDFPLTYITEHWEFGQYQTYNILRYHYRTTPFMIIAWNPRSANPKIYQTNHIPNSDNDELRTLLESPLIPKGRDFLRWCGQLGKTLTSRDMLSAFLRWQNPINEAIMKIAPQYEDIWDKPPEALFGKVYTKPKSLWQKLGITKEQFRLLTGSRYRAYNPAWMKKAALIQKDKPLAQLSLLETKDLYLRSNWVTRELYLNLLDWYGVNSNNKTKSTIQEFVLEPQNHFNFASYQNRIAFCDALRAATQLRAVGELPATLEKSMRRIMTAPPEDIMRWHDELSELFNRHQARIRAAQDRELQEHCWQLDSRKRKQWEYAEGEYIIRLPATLEEIRQEGSQQGICIASYTRSHAIGNTNLLFVRKISEPNKPFLAIELDNNKRIRQIHGKHNSWVAAVDPNVVPVLYRWIAKNKLQCEDRILLLQATSYGGQGTWLPKPEY